MAEYVANSTVRVLKDVPLDDSYTDVIKFESIGAQTSYFSSKAKRTFSKCTYLRVNSSVATPRPPLTVRVNELADNLYDCNYIMFQNTNFGTKWFYAFIKQVNYINPNNTEIVYELDHYQTWQFDFTVLPSFVEREHENVDERYLNRQPENFGVPELYHNSNSNIPPKTFGPPYYIRVWTTYGPGGVDGNIGDGSMMDNVYNGLHYTEFTTASAVNSFIREKAESGHLSSVISVNMSPFSMGSAQASEDFGFTNGSAGPLNGYTPRNKKCYNYPYTALTVSDNAGNVKEFKYEGFCEYGVNNGMPTVSIKSVYFKIHKLRAYSAALVLVPRDYYGKSYGDASENFDHAMTIANFPECAWVGDSFTNWLQVEGPTKMWSGVISVIAAIAGGGTGVSQLGGMVGTYLESNILANNPAIANGANSPSTVSFKLDRVLFEIKELCATTEFLTKLDKLFDMYGYAVNTIKVPNMTGRASWNFVKTHNVIIKGSLPVDSMTKIKNMFDSGVRFWHGELIAASGRSVGDFSMENNILVKEES